MSDGALFDRLMRRVFHLVARTRILSADDAGVTQRAQAKYKDDDLRSGLLRAQEYGFSSVPPPGTDAIVVHLAGERAQGVIIATNDPISRPRGHDVGDVVLYDNRGGRVEIIDGQLHVTGGPGRFINIEAQAADVVVTVDPGRVIRLNGTVDITGNVNITGDVAITGDLGNFGQLVNNGQLVGSSHTHAILPGAVGTGGETGIPGS